MHNNVFLVAPELFEKAATKIKGKLILFGDDFLLQALHFWKKQQQFEHMAYVIGKNELFEETTSQHDKCSIIYIAPNALQNEIDLHLSEFNKIQKKLPCLCASKNIVKYNDEIIFVHKPWPLIFQYARFLFDDQNLSIISDNTDDLIGAQMNEIAIFALS